MTLTLFDLNIPAPKTTPPPARVPRWAAAYETDTGTPMRLAGCRAIPRTCHHCGKWTLTGYDAPLIGGLATVDPYLASPLAEAAAVILGLPTYQLWGTPGHYQLTARHDPHIAHPIGIHAPADTVPVTITHTCHPPLASTPLPVHPPRTAADHGEPPF